jgi:hypothetical protein
MRKSEKIPRQLKRIFTRCARDRSEHRFVGGDPMATPVLDAMQLLRMTQAQLDALFMASPSGPIPDGGARGTAIIAPGTVWSPEIAEFINFFVWQGKTFDAQHGVLTNRILPFGLNAIVAEVYKEASWLDQKECIVLDYSKTSLVAHWVRDEIRLIGPNFYLGKVYWDRKQLIDFCLQFQ